MKHAVSEKEIIEYLRSLKLAEGDYPSDLFKARREMFIRQAASLAMTLHLSGGNGGGISSSSASHSTFLPTMGTLVEIVLVTVIIIEAGLTAYLYRERIAERLNPTASPRVEQTIEAPANPLLENISITGEIPVSATPSPASTTTATGTLSSTTPTAQETNIKDTQVSGTPTPRDHPGLHLGQTPKPERTLPSDKPDKPGDDGGGKDREPRDDREPKKNR
ncbi:MAG TPA: hypothetical protein VNK49_03370 [Anaerolineales bacterium]|nr:hypothetical protein [Anaerolineales bacterium]